MDKTTSWESYSPEELIKQMTVNCWTPHKTPDEVMGQHFQKSVEETTVARSLLSHKLGISYGSQDSQVFDEYGTDLDKDATILFWIHGGYWQEGTKEIAGHMAPLLVSRGIRNIVADYSLAPKVTLSEIQDEIIQAIAKIGEMFPKTKIIVGGHSAGGQLTANLLHTKSPTLHNSFEDKDCLCQRIVGLIFSSGVFDLRPVVATPLNVALGLTNETAETSSPLMLKEIHPHFLKGRENFQNLILLGEYESPEFKRQSQEYHNLLLTSFPKTNLATIAKEDHFSVVETLSQKDSEAGKELGKFLDNLTP